ncbi:MAG: ABC transporter permease [Fusobacteriota bacterium]
MLLTKLALKNLTRHKRRVVLTAMILSVGIVLYLFSYSLVGGIAKMSFDNLIDLETGHIQIMDTEHWNNRDEMKLDHMVSWDKNLENSINSINEIKGYMPQIKFSANLNNGIDEIPVFLHGIDVKSSKLIFDLNNYIGKGEYITQGKKEIIIGKPLADLMDLEIGDYPTFIFKTTDGAFNTIDARISGFLNTPNPNINNSYVYMPLNTLQNSLNADNQITSIVIRINGQKEEVPIVKSKLNENITDKSLGIFTWEDLGKSVANMIKQQNIETAIMMILFLALASIGVVNTIFLSSLERTKEIGMMKALGFKKSEIMKVFMIEAAGIGVIGGIIGVILGIPAVYYCVEKGIDIGITGDEWGVPIMNVMYGVWIPNHFLWIFLGGILISVIASYFPANWAAKKDPVETLENRPI